MPTPREIFNAASSIDPSRALEAIGLPKPRNYGDVWRTMSDAYDRMTLAEQRIEDNETRVRLNYIASATKVPGAAPKFPEVRYTKDPA